MRNLGASAPFFLGILHAMKKTEIFFGILRVPCDALAAAVALLLAYRLRTMQVDLIPGVQLLDPATTLPPPADYLSGFVWPAIILFLISAAVLGLYSLRSGKSGWSEIGRILEAACIWLIVVIGWFFLIKRQLFFSRILLLHSALFLFLFVAVVRGILILAQRAMLRSGVGVRAVASVGSVSVTEEVERILERDIHYRYIGHYKRCGDLINVIEAEDLDLVLHTDPQPENEATQELIEYCRSEHVDYAFFPPVLTESPHQLAVERMGLLPLIRFRPTPLDGWGRVWKRAVDFVAALLLLVILSPVLLIVSLLIILDSGFPVFYRSKRIGIGGKKKISVLKFRTMIKDADAKKQELVHLNHRTDGPLFKVKGDPRITRVGHLLRRWSIDELPNLFNVLSGHMAIVGPRPHLPDEVQRYSSYQRRVFAICPGITGLAQISGRSDLSFEEEVRLDLQYIEEWSPLLDLWILWRTPFVVLGRKGAD